MQLTCTSQIGLSYIIRHFGINAPSLNIANMASSSNQAFYNQCGEFARRKSGFIIYTTYHRTICVYVWYVTVRTNCRTQSGIDVWAAGPSSSRTRREYYYNRRERVLPYKRRSRTEQFHATENHRGTPLKIIPLWISSLTLLFYRELSTPISRPKSQSHTRWQALLLFGRKQRFVRSTMYLNSHELCLKRVVISMNRIGDCLTWTSAEQYMRSRLTYVTWPLNSKWKSGMKFLSPK